MELLEKIKYLYKGDVMAGAFYLFIGVLAFATGIALYYNAPTLGFYYLSIGFFIFSIYMLGKGSFMMFLYYGRYKFYKSLNGISDQQLVEEREYSNYRSEKKQGNRRRYLYTIGIGMIVAFFGVFNQEKGLIIATCIPIVLMSGIEFAVGLLTEFRLFEIIRRINKRLD